AFRLPLTVGAHVRDEALFKEQLYQLRTLVRSWVGPITAEPVKPPYKGVTLTRVRFHRDSGLAKALNAEGVPEEKRTTAAIYHARIGGCGCVSLSADSLRDLIDRAAARRDGKAAPGETVEVNTSLYVAPEAAFETAGALRAYLEWETFRRAV